MRAMRVRLMTIVVAYGAGWACGGGGQVAASSPSSESPATSASSAPAASSSPIGSGPSAPAASSAPPASSPPPPATGGAVLVGDIAGTPRFDPKPAVEAVKPDLLDCFNRARGANPALHGKLTLQIIVNEAGQVNRVDANRGGLADDAGFIACISHVLKTGAQFPKPGGMATVTAPLIFRR